MKMPAHTKIIAEGGINHNGSMGMAKRLIREASAAGADAVKFQMFKTERLLTPKAKKADYQKKTTHGGGTQWRMLKKVELDEVAFFEIASYCRRLGIEFMCTAFDDESLEFLAEGLRLRTFKVPSGDLTNSQLLLKTAVYGRPIILSTGMSTLDEVRKAMGVLAYGYTKKDNGPTSEKFERSFHSAAGQKALKEKVTLLHCVTEYPAPFEEVNLRAMDTLRDAFKVKVGFSDHTPGVSAAIAAAARGAVVIEKHLTLSRRLSGPDHQSSLVPAEFQAMVRGVRETERALGTGKKIPTSSELKNSLVARRSIVAACSIRKNELFTEKNITAKRPGNGMSPMFYWDLLGKRSNRDYETDEEVRK